MRRDNRLPLPPVAEPDHDPREGQGAEIIDLATRNVLPQVTQRRPGRDGMALFAGVVVVGLLGVVTLWSLNSARTGQTGAPPPAAQPQPAALPLIPPQAITPVAPAPQPALATPPQTAPAAAPGVNPANSPTVVFDAGALPGSPMR